MSSRRLRVTALVGLVASISAYAVPLAASGVAIGTGNVAKLAEAWKGATGLGGLTRQSPVVANGLVYIAQPSGKLYVFAATGPAASCAGAPKKCTPLWIGQAKGALDSTPALANGVVYITAASNGIDTLYAFDATGKTGCVAGLPKTCSPLWTAPTGDIVLSSPAVANGVVYVGSYDHKLYAFDAAGKTKCSGSPKRCSPLWTGITSGAIESSPTVAQGVVYVGSDDMNLYAFDAAGKTNCAGTPKKTCHALWTGATGAKVLSSPVVGAGYVFVGSYDHKLYAFDQAGQRKCTGVPVKCKQLWLAKIGVSISSAAVSGRTVYIGSDNHQLYAFDALGQKNCDYGTCIPLWTATTGGRVRSSPRVSNGLVFVGSDDHKIYAYSSAGTFKCTGSPRARVCQPLWSATTGGPVQSSPAIANGYVYVGSGDAFLHAYTIK